MLLALPSFQPFNLFGELINIDRKMNDGLSKVNFSLKLLVVGQVDLVGHVAVLGEKIAARGRVTCTL